MVERERDEVERGNGSVSVAQTEGERFINPILTVVEYTIQSSGLLLDVCLQLIE